MAHRPVFVPTSADATELVEEVSLEFRWHPGMAPSQKLKNVGALHQAADSAGLGPVLEVSTKSPHPLGQALSAFNLMVELPKVGRTSVEAAFQASKVFERGGPYSDMYRLSGRELKRDSRLREFGQLVGFRLGDEVWPKTPPTAFYDWLYLSALRELEDVEIELRSFVAFSDIEFNPARSLNCQARSCALYVALVRRNRLERAMESPATFLQEMVGIGPRQDGQASQQSLFDDPGERGDDG